MLNWWNSVEFFTRFATILAWTGGILGLIAASCGVGYLILNARASSITRDLQAPRQITEDQTVVMVEILKPFVGSEIMFVIHNDSEIRNYAEQLFNVFRTAGWKTPYSPQGRRIDMKGLHFVVPDPDSLPPEHAAIVEAFERSGVPLEIVEGGQREIGSDDQRQPYILVAFKPGRALPEDLP